MKFESDLTKLTRWIIPGWLGILSFYGFVIIDIIFTPLTQTRLFPTLTLFFSSLDTINAVIITSIIAASGIPLGFAIYQMYFFFRWNSPFSRDGLLPPFIAGRMNDLDRLLRDITFDELSRSVSWRKSWIAHPLFKRDHGFRARYVEQLFTESAQKLDTKYDGGSIYGRHRYLHEIMHTLGASIGATYFGFFSYFFIVYYLRNIYLPTYLILVTCFVFVLFFLLNREYEAKEKLELSRSSELNREDKPICAFQFSIRKINFFIDSPGSLFVISLFLLHLWGNPLFNRLTDPFDSRLRFMLSILMIIIWTISKPSVEFKRGDLLWLITSLLLAIGLRLAPQGVTAWIDWSFFTALFAFLVANLVLIQNRRNVSNDMLALEYYVLKLSSAELNSNNVIHVPRSYNKSSST